MSSETSTVTPFATASTPSVKANAKVTPAKGAQAAPAPGVKKVRAAYSGKGWYVFEKKFVIFAYFSLLFLTIVLPYATFNHIPKGHRLKKNGTPARKRKATKQK